MSETLTPEKAPLLPPENSKKPEKKKGVSVRVKIIAGLTTVALAGGAALAFGTANNGEKPAEATSTSASANPGETTAPTPEATQTGVATEQEITVQSLEIPSTVPAEQAAAQIEQHLAEWQMAGTTETNDKRFMTFQVATGELTNEIAVANAKTFTKALLVPDWQSNPNLVAQVNLNQTNNSSRIESWFLTKSSDDPADTEPYKYWATIDSMKVTASAATSASVEVTATEHNNAAKNRIGSQYHPSEVSQNGNRYLSHYKLQVVDGTWKISDQTVESAPSGQ